MEGGAGNVPRRHRKAYRAITCLDSAELRGILQPRKRRPAGGVVTARTPRGRGAPSLAYRRQQCVVMFRLPAHAVHPSNFRRPGS